MRKRPTACELEIEAAGARRPGRAAPLPITCEAAAMLARRGFRPTPAPLDVPFPPDIDGEAAGRLARALDHYGFRLFLRGAIQQPEGFAPEEATRYLTPARAKAWAEALVELGLAIRPAPRFYRLLRTARSFGGTLEWYVARELRLRHGFDVAAGLKFRAPGVGGDLDVVAAAEGKLVYLELKSSPPRNLGAPEVAAFFHRLSALRPDVALFVMDTALRLADKVVPMLAAELERRLGQAPPAPTRVEKEIWALTPHLFAVNARPDLVLNVGRALAAGFRALSPPAP